MHPPRCQPSSVVNPAWSPKLDRKVLPTQRPSAPLPNLHLLHVPSVLSPSNRFDFTFRIVAGIKIVFTGNSYLMLDFNSILSRWKPITFEGSLNIVKKVKARDYQLYLSLFDVLSRKEKTPSEIYHDDHDDLRKEAMRFKPHVLEPRINNGMSLFLLPVVLFSLFLVCESNL